MDCLNVEENLQFCNCTYEPCSRKGRCCECMRYHVGKRELPACAFTPEAERTCDRSFARFVKDNSSDP
jgi:hypothetical protein